MSTDAGKWLDSIIVQNAKSARETSTPMSAETKEEVNSMKWERDGSGSVFQGSHLGDTAIVLDDVYEQANEDCDRIEEALESVPKLKSQLAQLTRERAQIDEAIASALLQIHNQKTAYPHGVTFLDIAERNLRAALAVGKEK